MKYDFLISHMTLEEKASLMSGADFWHTAAIERLGIPSVMMTDGPHGLRKQSDGGDHLGLGKSVPATCYPTASALANSWNETLVEEMGRYYGKEAVSEKVSMVLGPGVNIKRNPLCGRNFEYFSEDPYLSGKMAAALIRGIQSTGVYACVKHYAVNSQETHRMTVDSVLDERTLREIYLPAFEMAVKEGGVKALMTCYNKVNGTYGSENQHLLRDILYNEWGFDGLVVTDWGANNDRVEGIKAGLTLEMPSCNGITDRQLVSAVQSGELDEKLLDEQLDRLLDMVFSTGKSIDLVTDYDRAKHHLFAQKVAEETAVLLKNEDNILPIKGRDKRVALIGSFASKPRYQGAGSSKIEPTSLDTAVNCLPLAGMAVLGFAEGFERYGGENAKLLSEAVELAGKADIAVLYLGLDERAEAEGKDREHIFLPDNQLKLLKAVSEVNPNVVVVLSCGGVVQMQWQKYAKAIIHGFLSGQAGAMAMARLLTGKANPSGKLSETIPINLDSVPSAAYFPGKEATAEYREGIYVGYRYYESAGVPAMYPFGYGLSYTSFDYSDLKIEADRVHFTVENTGSVAGTEIAQLYISAHTGGMFRPKKELKGFVRCDLQPGEKRQFSILLDDRSFSVWSILEHKWVIEPGEYNILIGASCTDIRLSGSVTKGSNPVENPYTDEVFKPYYEAAVYRIDDASFKALLGRKIPRKDWDRTKRLSVNDNIAQGQYLDEGLGRTLYNTLTRTEKLLNIFGIKQAAENLSFVKEMPYRGIGRMSGKLDDKQMLSLMKMINGDNKGLKELVLSFERNKRDKKK